MIRRLTITLPDDLFEKLRTEAFYRRTTFSAIVREKLGYYTKRKGKAKTKLPEKHRK